MTPNSVPVIVGPRGFDMDREMAQMHETLGRLRAFVDEGAERLHGYSAEEVAGRELSMLYTPEEADAGRPAADLSSAARDGRHESESWQVRKDGTQFWANIITVGLYTDEGVLRGFARVTRDITERRRAEEQLVHDALHDAIS